MRNRDQGSPKRPKSVARSAILDDRCLDDRRHASDRSRHLDQDVVLSAYARWAPIYDFVFAKLLFFGSFFDRGRELAIEHINTRSGTVLEVGIGTGVALGRYAPHLAITGIDLSPDMLAVARRRVLHDQMSHVRALLEMDAGDLSFASDSFDTVALMYTITVVPHPSAVLDEAVRVLKRGGEAVFVSHFASSQGWRGRIERCLVPITKRLGWRPDFPVARILNHPDLELVEIRRLPPFGVFSIVRLRKRER